MIPENIPERALASALPMEKELIREWEDKAQRLDDIIKILKTEYMFRPAVEVLSKINVVANPHEKS